MSSEEDSEVSAVELRQLTRLKNELEQRASALETAISAQNLETPTLAAALSGLADSLGERWSPSGWMTAVRSREL